MSQDTQTTNETPQIYAIESRWPAWSRWRRVTAKPHGEPYEFDSQTRELRFQDQMEAIDAAHAMQKSNAGEYRVVEVS